MDLGATDVASRSAQRGRQIAPSLALQNVADHEVEQCQPRHQAERRYWPRRATEDQIKQSLHILSVPDRRGYIAMRLGASPAALVLRL